MKINCYSHGIEISNYDATYYTIIANYINRFIKITLKYDNRTKKYMVDKRELYVASTPNYKSFWLHISLLGDFQNYLVNKGYPSKDIVVEKHAVPRGQNTKFTMIKNIQLRDEQIPAINYLLKNNSIRMLDLQTGKGKTLCSLYAMSKIGKRTLLIIAPKYMPVWEEELNNLYGDDFIENECVFIQGREKLVNLINSVERDDFTFSLAIVSTVTLSLYINEWLSGTDEDRKKFIVKPIDICRRLKIGLVITDEAHECGKALHVTTCMTSVNKIIYLSATIESDDRFITMIYGILFPMEIRRPKDQYDVYANLTNIRYGHLDDKLRYKGWGGTYSHVAYEQSILKKPKTSERYFKFITYYLKKYFIDECPIGTKAIVYFTLTESCYKYEKYLNKEFPDKKVVVIVSGVDKTLMNDADIVVITVKSGSTSLNVPNAIVSFLTPAIGSSQLFLQILGRLRKLKGIYLGLPQTLYCFTCVDIRTHADYERKRSRLVRDKVINLTNIGTTFKL